MDGWHFWQFERAPGEWVRLTRLREWGWRVLRLPNDTRVAIIRSAVVHPQRTCNGAVEAKGFFLEHRANQSCSDRLFLACTSGDRPNEGSS